ncbi:Transcription factor 25, partial [Desmophyllum pertusum]
MPGPMATLGESTSRILDTKALLGVEHRNLNAENEMKKRFGSHIVRAEQRQRRAHQRCIIAQQGINMKALGNKMYSDFAFEHSPSYQEVQFLFLDAVESLNPNNISAATEQLWSCVSVLLSLDPDEDPLGVLLMIDYYCLTVPSSSLTSSDYLSKWNRRQGVVYQKEQPRNVYRHIVMS